MFENERAYVGDDVRQRPVHVHDVPGGQRRGEFEIRAALTSAFGRGDFLFPCLETIDWRIQENEQARLWDESRCQTRQPVGSIVPVSSWIDQDVKKMSVEKDHALSCTLVGDDSPVAEPPVEDEPWEFQA